MPKKDNGSLQFNEGRGLPQGVRRYLIVEVIFKQIERTEKEQIIIAYREMRPELLDSALESLAGLAKVDIAVNKNSNRIIAYHEKEVFYLKPGDILYIESVDRKTFLYCKDRVYESAQKLKEFEVELHEDNFIRISRTMLINLDKIRSFFPALAGQMGAVMANEEKLIVSRRYVDDVRVALGLPKGMFK